MLRLLLFVPIVLATSSIFAQIDTTPINAVISANQIQATVRSNGSLFWDGNQGQFALKDENGNVGPSLSGGAGLWMAAIDPGGNLRMAVQSNQAGKSDYAPGLFDPDSTTPDMLIDFNKIWRVTAAEIEAHIADFNDNGTIDNPIPAIFGWPGRGNPSFEDYNDFPILMNNFSLAPFWDEDGNGIYNPNMGDYPVVEIRGCGNTPLIADEMLWFTFHDKITHTESLAEPLSAQIHCQVFAFNCTPSSIINNTVFTSYKIINRGIEASDSTHLGLYHNIQIGCDDDDFVGSIPELNTVFSYNSDAQDESCGNQNGLGENPPIFSTTLLRLPINELGENVSLFKSTYFFDNNSSTPAGTQFPEEAFEFYNYLTGSWKDNSPFTEGDDGYQDGTPIENIFPGTLDNTLEWSEISANNNPGNRNLLASTGNFRLDPGAVNEFILAFSATPTTYTNDIPNTDALEEGINTLQDLMDNCFQPDFLSTTCEQISNTAVEPEWSASIKLAPNPANTFLELRMETVKATELQIVDYLGRSVFRKVQANEIETINTGNWPAGVYFLLIKNGTEIASKKVVVTH